MSRVIDITFIVNETFSSGVRILNQFPCLRFGESVPKVGEYFHHISRVDIPVLVIIEYPQYN